MPWRWTKQVGGWGKPLRHVMANMGPIHLVDVSVQLQKGSVWRLLFHLVGAAGSSHRMKGNQVKKFSQSKVQKGTCTKMSHERDLTANMNQQIKRSNRLQMRSPLHRGVLTHL